MQMPDAEKGADRLHYKAANSAALHPCVVYADFEVFNDRAPEQISGHKVLSKQDRVASFAYQAVGRAGFEVPLEHRINLKRSGCEDGEFVIVEYLLRSLLDLAHHYKQWRSWTNKPCQMTQEDEDRFFEALECEICGAAFDLKNRKVLHHEHGAGKFLAAACNSCNLAIRLPSLIPVYFHNGASYDIHFILRYLAHVRGRQNSVDHDAEGIEGEASESEEIEEAAEEDFDPWRCDLSKIRLDVLVKRGEQCLTVRFGPLRFVDSTNIFPAGLSKLIEDCKTSCRGRDPGEAFPLLAERHPLFAAAQKQAHPFFMALQRRVPEWRAKVWELLLKKIPMPFDVLSAGTGRRCCSRKPTTASSRARDAPMRSMPRLGRLWNSSASPRLESSTMPTSTPTWRWQMCWNITGRRFMSTSSWIPVSISHTLLPVTEGLRARQVQHQGRSRSHRAALCQGRL